MLRRFLDFQLSHTEKGKPFHFFRPLAEALDTFFYESSIETKSAPHIRDVIDLKRWMMLVVFALFPCILVAIWNSGVQTVVYTEGDFSLLSHYLKASESLSSYFTFCFSNERWLSILATGAKGFLPVMVISYLVGGFWEILFALIRRHEVSEGFLVTGMLFALILPSTIPYWMVAVGVSAGVVIGKEIFGGTGMNILNPALVCRAFLFFAFPTKMTGPVWVGTNPTIVHESLTKMNREAELTNTPDAISQHSSLNFFNVSSQIKRLHVDALAYYYGEKIKEPPLLQRQYRLYQAKHQMTIPFLALPEDTLRRFVTAPYTKEGLGLRSELYDDAISFMKLRYGKGLFSNGNLFFGNRIGSMGETSILACLLGAFILLITRIGSWHTMVAVIGGAAFTAILFEWGAHIIGPSQGMLNSAKFAFPAYKHFLLGSLAFGLVFMATDPVSSPDLKGARLLYGFLIGMMVIVIRVINPAFPEGVMLAILFGNVFAPLFDYLCLNHYKRRYERKKARF